MKAFFIMTVLSCLAIQGIASNCNDMSAVRNKFHAAGGAKKLQLFLSFVKKTDCPQAYPYMATAIMKQAEYVSSPLKKLQYFKKGKAMLENYIVKYPSDLEARYVRVMVQKNVPSILGYSDKILSDKKFIYAHISSSGLSGSYQKTILKYIKS